MRKFTGAPLIASGITSGSSRSIASAFFTSPMMRLLPSSLPNRANTSDGSLHFSISSSHLSALFLFLLAFPNLFHLIIHMMYSSIFLIFSCYHSSIFIFFALLSSLKPKLAYIFMAIGFFVLNLYLIIPNSLPYLKHSSNAFF